MKLLIDDGVARGRVRTPDGYDSCRSHVVVKVLRNGKAFAKVETRASGRFRAKLPETGGRYVAVAPQVVVDDSNLCARARSKTRRA